MAHSLLAAVVVLAFFLSYPMQCVSAMPAPPSTDQQQAAKAEADTIHDMLYSGSHSFDQILTEYVNMQTFGTDEDVILIRTDLGRMIVIHCLDNAEYSEEDWFSVAKKVFEHMLALKGNVSSREKTAEAGLYLVRYLLNDCSDIDSAQVIFDSMATLNNRPEVSVDARGWEDQMEDAIRTKRKDAAHELFNCYMEKKNIAAARALYENMQAIGPLATAIIRAFSANVLINTYCAANDITSAEAVYDDMLKITEADYRSIHNNRSQAAATIAAAKMRIGLPATTATSTVVTPAEEALTIARIADMQASEGKVDEALNTLKKLHDFTQNNKTHEIYVMTTAHLVSVFSKSRQLKAAQEAYEILTPLCTNDEFHKVFGNASLSLLYALGNANDVSSARQVYDRFSKITRNTTPPSPLLTEYKIQAGFKLICDYGRNNDKKSAQDLYRQLRNETPQFLHRVIHTIQKGFHGDEAKRYYDELAILGNQPDVQPIRHSIALEYLNTLITPLKNDLQQAEQLYNEIAPLCSTTDMRVQQAKIALKLIKAYGNTSYSDMSLASASRVFETMHSLGNADAVRLERSLAAAFLSYEYASARNNAKATSYFLRIERVKNDPEGELEHMKDLAKKRLLESALL